MALNPMKCSQELTALICDVAAINPDGSPKPADIKPKGDFPTGFAKAYNNYAKDGEVLGGKNSGGDESILAGALDKTSAIDVSDLALAFAEFWNTVAVDPGDPEHGGTSVSASTNNAMSLVGDFEDAINASLTDEEKMPMYLHFIENLEGAAKKIIWTIVEEFPAGSSEFQEPIK